MLSSNHCRETLTIFLDNLGEKQDKVKETVVQLSKEIQESENNKQIKRKELKTAKETIKNIEQWITTSRRWAIQLYN